MRAGCYHFARYLGRHLDRYKPIYRCMYENIYIYVFVYACILKTLFVLYVSCCLILILIPAKMNRLEVDRLKQAVQELVAHWFTGTDRPDRFVTSQFSRT